MTTVIAGLPLSNDNYVPGGNADQVCVACHVNIDSFKKHGLLAADSNTVHENLAGSLASGAADPLNCENCHASSDAETRINLHLNCNTCHDPVKTDAMNQINLGMGVTSIECEDCHVVATGAYTMHKMTVADVGAAGIHENIGFDAGCVDCHNLTVPTETKMLELHTAPQQGHDGTCLTCHNPTNTTDSLLAEPALTVIFNGQNSTGKVGGGNSPQTCVGCHDGGYLTHGLADGDTAHPTLADPDFPTNSESNCGTCHTITTVANKLTLHTGGCLICHNSTDPQVMESISDGYAATPVVDSTAPCEECHGGTPQLPLKDISGTNGWFNHNDPDHTSVSPIPAMQVLADNTESAVPHIDNCVSCHNAATQVLAHDLVSADGNPCDTCHDATGGLASPSSADPYVSGLAECVVCHTTFPNAHTHHDSAVTNQVAYDVDTDTSQGSDVPANACGECHPTSGDNTVFGTLATPIWSGILAEHDVQADGGIGCNTCHNAALLADKTGEIGTPDDTLVGNVIGTDATAICTTCHTLKLWSNAASGHGGHDDSHFGWGTDGCENCHGAGLKAEPVVSDIHGNFCEKCHNDGANATKDNNGIQLSEATLYGKDGDAVLAEGDAGTWTSTCLTCHPIATYDLSTVHHDSLEWSVTNPGSCTATCHVQGVSAAVSGDHATTFVTTHANCSTCHTATAATGFTIPVNADLKTHDACQSCHNADPSASLKAAGGLPLADANPIGGGTCDTCHADFTIHASHNHATVGAQTDTSTITKNCQSCHTGGSTPFVPESHTDCASCHAAVTGALVNSSIGNAATPTDGGGYPTDGVFECGECHAGWFDGHQVHDNTTHAITTGADTDGTSPCSDCHKEGGTGSANPLYDINTWGGASGIFALHQSSCVYCHDKTTGTKIDFTSSVYADLQDAIMNGGGGVTCLDCHSDRGSGHAGHEGTQFGWTTASEQSCGGEGIVGNCHDSTVNTDVMAIHDGPFAADAANGGNRCNNCHNDGVTGDGTVTGAGNFGHADASVADKNDHTGALGECMVCHLTGGRTKQSIHHNVVPNVPPHNADSANGLCENCHMDRRPAAKIAYGGGIGDYKIIKQKACRACHMQITGGVLEVLSIKYAKENSAAATGDDSGNTYTVVKVGNNSPRDGHAFTVNHTVPTNASVIDNTAIDNYGTCYYCHGEQGSLNYMTNATKPGGTFSMDTPKMVPYHALPLAGAYNAGTGQANNTIGGCGWQEELGPVGCTETDGRFRGNLDYVSTANINSYYPIGKGRMNIGYAQHSLANKAAKGVGGGNELALVNFYESVPAGLNMGRQIVRNDSATAYSVPHFDPICTSASGDPCDDVSITGAYTADGDIGFDITVESSTGQPLHIIVGGLDLGTCLSGVACRIDYNPAISDLSHFNYAGAPLAWVVSEGGGSMTFGPYLGISQ